MPEGGGEKKVTSRSLRRGWYSLRRVSAPRDSLGPATPPLPTLQEGREREEYELKVQQGRKHEVIVYELLSASFREKAKACCSPFERHTLT